MKIQRCKGTRDSSPEEMVAFRLIEGVFRDCCLKWGYKEVRTPTIEYLHLFTSAGTLTPSMLGKVYSFLDWDGWSGERVVLKPDGTIPVARLYIDSMKNEGLAKLFYVTNIFIFEETGSKARERWQCGTELIGAGSPLADTELISLALEILKGLGLKGIELRLSHAGLIKTILAKLGLSSEEQISMFDQILDGDMEALDRVRLGSPELQDILLPLLSLRGQSAGFLKNLKALSQKLPEARTQLDNFISIADLLGALGCDYKIDIASGAGFEYYTGVIFQLFIGAEKIGGGGRYDALIPSMGGGNIPASGFALYLDRLMRLVKLEAMAKSMPIPQRILVRAKSGKTGVLKETFSIASRLREAGLVVGLGLDDHEPVDYRWILDVKSEAPSLTLFDKVKSDRVEVKTIGEVLALLREKGADKDSSA
ncbi:ATP phosphoribosyltransferase regulatory subunit [Chloroflexota bacterium]